LISALDGAALGSSLRAIGLLTVLFAVLVAGLIFDLRGTGPVVPTESVQESLLMVLPTVMLLAVTATLQAVPSRSHTRRSPRAEYHAALAAKRTARRDLLVRAATDAIRRLGPEASMDAMAAEAGITKPILYRYFGDREGLIAAVADCFAGELVTRLEKVLLTDEPPGVRTQQAIDSYVAFIEEDPALYGFFANHAAVGGPTVRSVVDRVAAALARPIGEVMREAGVDSAPAETWAYGIVGMVHMAGANWAAHPTIPRHRLIEYLTELTRFGLEGPRRS
jgi:AcrR family transcriptional regulator